MLVFANQIAVVTGASGGIGGAIATKLVKGGAHVEIVGRDTSRLEALREQLGGLTGSVTPVVADLVNDNDLAALADHVDKRFGRLDILVHSAGSIAHGRLEESSIDALDALYRSNVRGPFLLTKQLLPLLKRPRGQIVVINSSAGLSARPEVGYYSAAQHAVKALTDGLRSEVNADQIRVLGVYPGRTATQLMAALSAKEGRPYEPGLLLQPDDIANVVTNALAMPWTAEVTDINIRPMRKSY